jgi:hypothetical protein
MHDGICNRHDGLNSQLIFAEQTTSLTETSVKTPGSVLVRSVESDASWKSEIMAHATELHRSVLRMIVIAKRLNCRWGGGFDQLWFCRRSIWERSVANATQAIQSGHVGF